MDRFRIESIARYLESDVLNETMRNAAIGELENKCRIYILGAVNGEGPKKQNIFGPVCPYCADGPLRNDLIY